MVLKSEGPLGATPIVMSHADMDGNGCFMVPVFKSCGTHDPQLEITDIWVVNKSNNHTTIKPICNEIADFIESLMLILSSMSYQMSLKWCLWLAWRLQCHMLIFVSPKATWCQTLISWLSPRLWKIYIIFCPNPHNLVMMNCVPPNAWYFIWRIPSLYKFP